MTKARVALLVFFSLFVTLTFGIGLFLKVYLPRPEPAARLSQLLSRSFGIEITIGRIEVPFSWTMLGPVVLHDIVIRSTQMPLFQAQSVKFRPRLLPLLRRELKLRWIEAEGPVLHLEGSPFKECDVLLASLDGALEALANLEREAPWLPVDRLKLTRGILAMTRFRLNDVELRGEGWGQPLHHVNLRGKLALFGASFPFHAEAQVSAYPFHMASWIRLEEVPLASLKPWAPTLDLRASHATALLTFVASEAEQVEGFFEARVQGVFILGSKEPWDPTLQARFRLNPAKGEASLSEAILTAPGIQAKGEGKGGCSGKGVGYAIKTKDFVMNLTELRGKVPGLPGEVGGHVVIQALEAKGVWPGPSPRLKITGLVEGMGPFSLKQIRLSDLNGPWQIEGDLDRLRARVALNGIGRLPNPRPQTGEGEPRPYVGEGLMPSRRLASGVWRLALTGSIQGSVRQGDFNVGPLKVEIDPLGQAGPSPMLRAGLKGVLKEWGKASTELETGPLQLHLPTLNQLIASHELGFTVEALEPPSFRFMGGLKALPYGWEAWAEVPTLFLRIPGRSANPPHPPLTQRGEGGIPLRIRGVKLELFGRGMEKAEGTILGKALSMDGHLVENLQIAFAFHEGGVAFKDLRAEAFGGEVEGEGTFTPSESDLRFRVHNLRLGRLFATLQASQGLPFLLPPPSQASSFQVSAETSLRIGRSDLSFRLKTEPLPATEVAAFALGRAFGLPGELHSGEIFGEVVGAWGLGSGIGGLELSGTLSLKKVVVHLRIPPVQKGRERGFQPLTFSGSIPFEYRGGTFRFWGDGVPLDARSLPPLSPIHIRGGEVILSWQGQVSPSPPASSGQAPSAGSGQAMGFRLAGEALLQRLELEWAQGGGPPRSLTPLSGVVPFTFEDGLLKVPEVPLTIGDQARIFLAATLPLDAQGGQLRSLTLLLPPTKTLSLQKAIPGLLPKVLLDTHLQGALEAKVEMVGDQVQGEVRIQEGGIDSRILTIQGLSARIPLRGRFGALSKRPVTEWPELSEQAFEDKMLRSDQQAVSQTPDPSFPSLTIASLSFAGLTLQDLTVHFSPRNNSLVIDHLSFQGLGGSGRGRGLLDLFGGSLHLAILVEGLSLREICDQFPPIKGYITGKAKGMLDVSLPLFEPSQAKGRARFWVVTSKEEPRKISKALIERLGGQSGGFLSLLAFRGDRPYDHGLLEVILQDRSLLFHHLEISNTILFIKDLDIKVVPPYNTISVQDLFDTIQETWERVQG